MTLEAKILDDAHVLVVEDDDELSALLVQYLEAHGFKTRRAANGNDGAKQILESNPDLVILDLMLPGMNGLDVCRQVRARYAGGILMLTASQSEADHVAGLELGADDFVTKPIEPRVLLARIRTQLRRQRGAKRSTAIVEGPLQLGPLRLELSTQETFLDGDAVPLTAMEFKVLRMLAQHAGTVVERDTLYSEILGTVYDGIDRGMDIHVSRIRRKLQHAGFDPGRLKSVRGAGYLLVAS